MKRATRARKALTQALQQSLRSKLGAIQADRHSDELDGAVWSENVAVAVQTIEAEWQRERLVRAALDRIQSGHYGVCDQCGHAIADARLAALPWATSCVGCQEREERDKASAVSGEHPPMYDVLKSLYDDAV